MKTKFFFTVAALLASVTMMAEIAKINPTWEGNYRTNNATPTGWTKVTTTDEQFEVYNGARFFAVQTWTIANISQVTKLEFMYQRVSDQSNNGDIAFWFFPYNSMVESTDNYNTDGVAFLNDVKTVLGVYPGNTIDGEHAPFKVSESKDTLGAHFRRIALEGEQLATFKAQGTTENDVLTITVLLNTWNAINNYKYYHTGDNASYCNVTLTPVVNNTTSNRYTDLATAVAEATAGDILRLEGNVTISGSRLEIKKALTIQGATGAEKIISGVPYNTLMVLANDETEDYTVSFKNLIVDGQNVERDRQLFDLNGKAKMAFDGVSVINTTYNSDFIADVKTAGSNVILSGVNSFPAGIALNKNKRIDHQDATHTTPIRIILSGDYVVDYAIVLHCTNPDLYTAVDAADVTGWELYVSNSELKGRKVEKTPTAIDEVNTEAKAVKVLRNGQVLILRDGRTYNMMGVEVK